ncbi:MAG: hypothetical protein K6G69_09350 [Lachnospiraceae bacterium]|nr:hypothetical protein [Lachnospiraceae bacterium]
MRKALVYLGLSVLLLGIIISYDVTKCDGQVLMKYFIDMGDDYDRSYDKTYEAPVDKKDTAKVSKTKTNTTANTTKSSNEGSVTSVTEELDEKTGSEPAYEDIPEEDRGYEYYYGQLNDTEKAIYRAMYKSFSNIESGNSIPSSDDETMSKVAVSVKADHPEFFYVEEMGYVHYTLGGQIVKTTLSVTYADSRSMIETKRRMADEAADAIIATIPDGADEYTKVKCVYEQLIATTDYEINSPDNQNIISSLVNHRSVCAGYARAFQYILNRIGIPTTFVEGRSLITGEDHAWNMCTLSDGNYFVDVTWGDASYSGNGFEGEKVAGINYDYMLITTDELLRTHSINSIVEFPICDRMENNYFVREGLYFEFYDHDTIKAAFDRAYAEGRESISFKCANRDAYESVKDELIRNSGIFDMLNSQTTTVSYVEDEEQRTLCFWL